MCLSIRRVISDKEMAKWHICSGRGANSLTTIALSTDLANTALVVETKSPLCHGP